MVMVMALGKMGGEGRLRDGGRGALRFGCLRAWAGWCWERGGSGGWLVLRRFWVLGGDVAAGVQAGT